MRFYQPFLGREVDLDQWTREMVALHFDPDGGTPYWLRWQEERGIDVRREVQGFPDLPRVFGLFDGDVLRRIPATDFLPRRRLQDPSLHPRVYETGGTTGAPKRVVMTTYWRTMAAWTSHVLDGLGVPRSLHILALMPPGGNNNAGVFARYLARERGALSYHVNFDPRWVKKLILRGAHQEVEAYIAHLFDQAEAVTETQPVGMLFTTGRLLQEPRCRELVHRYGIRVVMHGGAALDPDTYRMLREEWYAGCFFCGEYGNTLMGVAPQDTRSPESREHLLYIPCFPYFVVEAVDPEDPFRVLPYGQRGRVKITVLCEDFFIPGMLERDEAERVPGREPYPWDWVRNPMSPEALTGREGVY
ncbi:MAG TPA: hypothetical protein VIK99_11230 [Thermaerobacter sp.]